MEISPGQMEALLEDEGAPEVDEGAAERLADILENYIGYITEEAVGRAEERERDAIGKEEILEAEK